MVVPEAKHFASAFCQVAFEFHELTLLAGGASCPFIALLPGRQDLIDGILSKQCLLGSLLSSQTAGKW